jgi:hypothetical protein
MNNLTNTSSRWRFALVLVAAVSAMMILPGASLAAARKVPFGFFGTVLDPAATLDNSAPALGARWA